MGALECMRVLNITYKLPPLRMCLSFRTPSRRFLLPVAFVVLFVSHVLLRMERGLFSCSSALSGWPAGHVSTPSSFSFPQHRGSENERESV